MIIKLSLQCFPLTGRTSEITKKQPRPCRTFGLLGQLLITVHNGKGSNEKVFYGLNMHIAYAWIKYI